MTTAGASCSRCRAQQAVVVAVAQAQVVEVGVIPSLPVAIPSPFSAGPLI